MDGEEIRVLVKSLDNTSFDAQEDPWSKLRPLGEAVVPFLVEQYPTFRRWQGRVALVYHSMSYARTREDAYQLGLLALEDKSSAVRFWAVSLLAYSLRKEALPALKAAAKKEPKVRDDIRAAIVAIKKQNHHLFKDRGRTGRIQWVVNEGDATA